MHDCYRCGKPVDDQFAFCPSCNAPQIRVVTPDAGESIFPTEPEPAAPSDPAGSAPSTSVPHLPGLQWAVFFRLASPWAAITGLLSFLMPPLGLLFMLPFSTRRTIARYRPFHAGPLYRGDGVRLGAFTALLSFFSFFIFSVATISLKHQELVQILQENARKNSTPQAQQMLYFISTNAGFFALMTITLLMVLAIFLLIGVASGALALPPSRPQNRP